jgi:hypothetical protein
MRFIATILLVLLPLCAQDAKKGGGGGRAPAKNLKVLTQEELNSGVMQKYVAYLGVGASGGCNFCHDPAGPKDSDANPKKDVARKMIVMVKDLNSKLSMDASKPAVTCYTCHRGKTEPDTAPPAQ